MQNLHRHIIGIKKKLNLKSKGETGKKFKLKKAMENKS
jgi:hypothetical protein